MDWLNYAGGSRQVFRQSALRWKQSPSKIVLHSTEGGGYPSAGTYRNGLSAPHITVDVKGRNFRQHYPFSVPAYALKAGTVSTNTLGAIQIEIIGTCDPRSGVRPRVFDFSDDDLRYLGGLVKAICDGLGIPFRCTVNFMPYPASYGNTAVRLSGTGWTNYRGICGHQHVPGNTHGDPGTLNVQRMISLVTGDKSPAPEIKDDDMYLGRSANGSITLFGPGWFRDIGTMEEVAAWQALGVPGPNALTDKQHAILRSTSVRGNIDVSIWNQQIIREGGSTSVIQEIADIKTALSDGVEINVQRLSDDDVKRIVDALATRLAD